MRQHHIRVRRTARYATLGGLEDSGGAAPRDDPADPPPISELWIVCHGYRQLGARFAVAFSPIASPERLVVAPEGLSRFYIDDDGGAHGPDAKVGATWMTREDRLAEIDDYVNYLDLLHARVLEGALASVPPGAPLHAGRDTAGIPGSQRRPRVCVLGFSQGTATVSRWLAFGSARIDRLILWAGAPAFDLNLDDPGVRHRFEGVRLTLVAGTEDRLYSPPAVERVRERLTAAGLTHALLTYPGGHRIDRRVLHQLADDDEERV